MKEYNEDEDVWYCKSCLSLKIIDISDDEVIPCYCDSCTSTDVGITEITTWERMYEQRYGKKYINKRNK